MASPLYVYRVVKPFVEPVLRPVLRPIARVLAGTIAIPAFRFVLYHVFRVKEIDAETEKDLGEWCRATAVLLFATPNMEAVIGNLLGFKFDIDAELVAVNGDVHELSWLILGGRLLLAVAAVESMPDQQLFSIIHPGPPKVIYDRAVGFWGSVKAQWRDVARGLVCLHLNRSSPVFAILAVIMDGQIGWICFGLAIAQYLIIGLVTSRDRAVDVLMQFDQRMAERRREIIEEFNIQQNETAAPIDVAPPTKVVHLR